MNLDGFVCLRLAGSLHLLTGDVHIWLASLDRPPISLRDLASILSLDERARASRFYFREHCNRFVAGRGLLRIILGGYLDLDPSQIRFSYGLWGKPALDAMFHSDRVSFNLAHSENLVLYAISRNHSIGIDVEHIRPLPEADSIAQQFFSVQENHVLHSLPAGQRLEAFFRLWTCKEACLKANGNGLTEPVVNVKIAPLVEESAWLVGREDQREVARWSLRVFRPKSDYLAALAVKGRDEHMKCLQVIDGGNVVDEGDAFRGEICEHIHQE